MPWIWSDKPDEPIILAAPRQGALLLALRSANRSIDKVPENLRAGMRVVFDWDKPLLKVLSIELVHRPEGLSAVNLRWAAWDENFGERPISLYWRQSDDDPWQLGVADLPNAGAYAWHLPDGLGGHDFGISLRATDLAGNVAQQVHSVSVRTNNARTDEATTAAAPATQPVAEATSAPAT